jgi:3-methyladenine DNA glycosylase Tag
MLGMIEHLYVGISSAIARTLHQRGWTATGSQSHYAFHEKLDT